MANNATLPAAGAVVAARDVGGVLYQVVMAAVRRDADTALDADGLNSMLQLDELGRLKVASQSAGYPLVSGTIAANGGSVSADVSRCSNVVVMMNTASLLGHNCTFEGSLDSTNGTDGVWFTLQAARSNANTIESATGALAATPGYSWELSVNACNWFRVRATAHTSGSATWKIQRGTYATEPIPAAQISGTQPVSGTVAATMTTPIQYFGTSTASTNATSIRASSANLGAVHFTNLTAATVYVKLYNKAGAPTVGTDVPAMVFPLAAGASVSGAFGTSGVRFGTGLSMAITAGAADTDTAAVGAGVKVSISYT